MLQVGFGVAAIASAATGSVLLRQSIEDLTRKSDLVVRATVASQEARWEPGGRLIYTFVHVRVREALKGAAAAEIILQRAGGTVGDITQKVHGAPEFAEGEDCILFLSRLPAAGPMYVVEGMAQGKLAVRGGVGGAPIAVQDTRGAGFLESGRIVPGAPAALPLSEVVRRVREAAGR